MRTAHFTKGSHFTRRALLSAFAAGFLLPFSANSVLFAQLDLGEISNPHERKGKAPLQSPSRKGKSRKLKKTEENDSQVSQDAPSPDENAGSSNKTPDEVNSDSRGKGGPIFSHPTRVKYRIGLSLEARPNGECNDVFGSVPFPMDFPDQKVRIIEDECTEHVHLRYRDLKEGGCRQLLVKIRTLYAGEKADAVVTVEVTRFDSAPPEFPYDYLIPKSIPKDIRGYLHESPYIEIGNGKIKKAVKNAVSEDDKPWRKAENILSFVRNNVKYKEAYKEKSVRGAVAAIETGEGDCEDMSALFIAMCRCCGIPARTVRVPEHCWAEFYLEDSGKNGYWFPAEVAGTEPLGYLTDHRIILQKGDAFRVPESPRETCRYVRELFTGKVKQSGADPIHKFIREEVR